MKTTIHFENLHICVGWNFPLPPPPFSVNTGTARGEMKREIFPMNFNYAGDNHPAIYTILSSDIPHTHFDSGFGNSNHRATISNCA